jgi:large subunit ribosomal protein L23
MDKTIVLRPHLSEKTYTLSERRVYVVEVPRGVNKHGVVRAVEAQFEVKVVKVNLTNIPGKAKRVMSITGKRVKNSEGHRNDVRKAYITLAEGNSLPFFAAVEEEEKKEEALQEKVDKAAAKQAEKADKKPRLGGLRLPKKASKAEKETE